MMRIGFFDFLRLTLLPALIFSLIGFFQPVTPAQAITSVSLFGYTYSFPNEIFSSISEIGIEELSLNGDDQVAGPIDLGFAFPFFENPYTSVYISTNGVLLFADSVPDPAVRNTPIPSDLPPNNFIAPFWDDLTMGVDGKVYRYFNSTESI